MNLAQGSCYVLLSRHQTALTHCTGWRNRKESEHTAWAPCLQCVRTAASEVGGMVIFHSSCDAGSTCKHLGEYSASADSKQGYVIFHYWCLVRQKQQSDLEFNLEEEVVGNWLISRKQGQDLAKPKWGWLGRRKEGHLVPTQECKNDQTDSDQ